MAPRTASGTAPRTSSRTASLAGAALALPAVLLGLAGCAEQAAEAGGTGALTVSSGDDTCQVSAASAAAGTVAFAVTNTGSQVTEFYLLAEDQTRIVGEVENIGPGISRTLTVQVPEGRYFTSCRPGMAGDGIRAAFTVTAATASTGPTGERAAQLKAATDAYAAYVRKESAALLAGTRAFAADYAAGRAAKARAAYAAVRVHWERIEPVAESFGDLDPRLDLREADLEPGQAWTGWHAVEKDLWPPAGSKAAAPARHAELARQLVADTVELDSRVATLAYTPAQLGNGAKELLDEVATGKVTGEEEAWSHTDLWDFQANVDGARTAYTVLRPVVLDADPQLAAELDRRFAAVQALLDGHRSGSGFVLYTDLTPAQVRTLAAAVDALGEPLSRLTAVVVA